MGAMAEAIAAYTQPLLDETDGSIEQMNDALALGQLCWNLALSPEKARDETLGKMRSSLKMSDDEFEEFRSSVIVSMIQRHQEMFPHMHRLGTTDPSDEPPMPQTPPASPVHAQKYHGTGRNAPCPCNSGKKYKRCCGR